MLRQQLSNGKRMCPSNTGHCRFKMIAALLWHDRTNLHHIDKIRHLCLVGDITMKIFHGDIVPIFRGSRNTLDTHGMSGYVGRHGEVHL